MLWGRDIGGLYRALIAAGMVQRQIAQLTGQLQSEVGEIIAGRRARVMAYEVLVRIAEGLTIPRERMGLSFWGPDGTWYGPPGTYPGGVTIANAPEGVSSAMLRRHLIALGGITLAGARVDKVGQLLDGLGHLPPASQPSQLSVVHVAQVRDLTQRLGEAGRTYGSNPQVDSWTAVWATQLLDLPGAEPLTRALKVAVAELQLHAGWSSFDGGRYRRALYHYSRALELALEAGDIYLQAASLHAAGLTTVEHGHPDDGLKMLQFAQVAAWRIAPDHDRRSAVEACSLADSATAHALFGDWRTAMSSLARGRELWTPTRTDPSGDLDQVAARLELGRGRLDVAEPLAAASLRRWEGNSRRARTRSSIVLATIHVRAGEASGLRLAHGAITDVTKLTSVRARRRLLPLIAALEAPPGSDARELARMARQVAA